MNSPLVPDELGAARTTPAGPVQGAASQVAAQGDFSPVLKAELAKVSRALLVPLDDIRVALCSVKGMADSQADQRVRAAILEGLFHVQQFYLCFVELASQVHVVGDDFEQSNLRIDKLLSQIEQGGLNLEVVPGAYRSLQQGKGCRDLPADAIARFESVVGNTVVSQWIASQSKLTVLEEMQASRLVA